MLTKHGIIFGHGPKGIPHLPPYNSGGGSDLLDLFDTYGAHKQRCICCVLGLLEAYTGLNKRILVILTKQCPRVT